MKRLFLMVTWLLAASSVSAFAQEQPPCLVTKILQLQGTKQMAARIREERRLVQALKKSDLPCREFDLTPLHAAVAVNAADMAQALLEKGANPNARGPVEMTPLMIAAQTNSPALTRLLLSKGADLAAHDAWGRTAPQLAAVYKHPTHSMR